MKFVTISGVRINVEHICWYHPYHGDTRKTYVMFTSGFHVINVPVADFEKALNSAE